MATRITSLSMRKPNDDTGRACSHAPDSFVPAASRRARAGASGADSRRFLYANDTRGASQDLWRNAAGAILFIVYYYYIVITFIVYHYYRSSLTVLKLHLLTLFMQHFSTCQIIYCHHHPFKCVNASLCHHSPVKVAACYRNVGRTIVHF